MMRRGGRLSLVAIILAKLRPQRHRLLRATWRRSSMVRPYA